VFLSLFNFLSVCHNFVSEFWTLYTLSRDSQPHVNEVVLGCGHCWSRVHKIV